MKVRLVASVAFLTALSAAHTARADDSDPWWGKDKALHFGISIGIAAGSYGAASLVFDRRAERAATAGAVTISVGAAKEGWDAMGHGDPSFKDFTWDVAGAAVGTGLAFLLDLALSGHGSETAARIAN
jgi:putative lipoprotein